MTTIVSYDNPDFYSRGCYQRLPIHDNIHPWSWERSFIWWGYYSLYTGFQWKDPNYDVYISTISIESHTDFYFALGAYIWNPPGTADWIAFTRCKPSGITFNFPQGYTSRLAYGGYLQIYWWPFVVNWTYYLDFQASGYKMPS